MIPLKYNTASQEVPLGYFLDKTDGDTAETGLTIANTDIQLWKSGATTLANKNSGGATHISGGIYYAVLDATDTNAYGPLKIFVHVAGALAVILECAVMNPDAYDALYAADGTGHIEADAVQISGDATAADNVEADYDGGGYNKSNSTIGTATANTDMVAEAPSAAVVADAVLDEALSGHVVAGSLGKAIADIETDATAIVADTGELQTNQGNWLTATGFSTHNAAAVWAVATRVLTAGTNLNDISTADVANELSTYDGPTKAELDSGFASLSDLDASETAAAVWDALLASYQDADSMGEALGDAGGAGTPPTVEEIRAEMDTNSTKLASVLGDTGELQTNQGNWLTATGFSTHDAAAVKTAIEAAGSHLALILADTTELQGNQGAWATATGFSTHDAAAVWAVATRVLTAGTNLNDISTADVNTEIDTAFTTIMVESVPVVGTIPTREQALYMIVQFLLERSTASTTVTVKKVDGSTTLMTLTLDDATTPTSISRAT